MANIKQSFIGWIFGEDTAMYTDSIPDYIDKNIITPTAILFMILYM